MRVSFATLFCALLVVAFAAMPLSSTQAQVAVSAAVSVHVFGSTTCPLCADATDYLRTAAPRENAIVYWHVAKDNRRETDLMFAVAKELGVEVDGYPFIVVGRRSHVGWGGATTGLIVTREITQVREAGEEDVVARMEQEIAAATPAAASERRAEGRASAVIIGLAAPLAVVVTALVGTAIKKRNRRIP